MDSLTSSIQCASSTTKTAGSLRASWAALISAVNRRRRASGSTWATPPRDRRCPASHRAAAGPADRRRETGPQPCPRDLIVQTADLADARSSRATTWNGTSVACDSQKVENTSMPGFSRAGRLRRSAGSCRCREGRPPHHRSASTGRAVQHGRHGGQFPVTAHQRRQPRHRSVARPRSAAAARAPRRRRL